MKNNKFFIAVLFMMASLCATATKAGVSCENSQIISDALITDTCWTCIFPIRIATIEVSPGGDVPSGAASSPLCSCMDETGDPLPGVVTSMWEPARLVEFQRTPGCMSVLNGSEISLSEKTFRGSIGNGEMDGGDGSFYHYHYYAFPLLQMLELFTKKSCNSDGFMDLDIMYLSEVDPTWNDSSLAYFSFPEAAMFANPVASSACAGASAYNMATGKPSNLPWCADTWGAIYPPSGHHNGGNGIIKDTSLLSVRVLATLHRRGFARKTMGNDSLCKAKIYPMLLKDQYKYTMMYPLPETESGHVIGESTLTWGAGRLIPGVANTPIYNIWRWNDCCNN